MATIEKKKGGPYTKDEQRKRREEVYRLHFEYGYSARKIAEFLKINRGTINRDIMSCYADIDKKWRQIAPFTYVKNQVEKLEIQRTRLRKQLDKSESFQQKIAIEKFLFNIELKITDIKIKLIHARLNITREITKGINDWKENKGSQTRVVSENMLFSVSENTLRKLVKILKEDEKF